MIVTESEQGTGVHLVVGRTVYILMMNIGILIHMQNNKHNIYNINNIITLITFMQVIMLTSLFTNLDLNHLNSC